jgi:hypothetical protein
MIGAYSRGRRRAASRRFRLLLMLAAAPALAQMGCRKTAQPVQEISISESIAPQPVRIGAETLLFRLTDAAHQPVADARVQVEADMDHPGMAPVFADAVETSPGNYSAPLNFTMGGDWVVLFHITLKDGRKVERQMDVKGVESN